LVDPFIKEQLDESIDLADRAVVVVEDMIDGGLTLNETDRHLTLERGATNVEYAVVYDRLDVERPPNQVQPKYVAMRLASELWALGEGPDDGRILQPGQDIDTTLPLDGGRGWPGLWLNRPE
jgi:hypoxanthine-guanine phosphoribosyltransferase